MIAVFINTDGIHPSIQELGTSIKEYKVQFQNRYWAQRKQYWGHIIHEPNGNRGAFPGQCYKIKINRIIG